MFFVGVLVLRKCMFPSSVRRNVNLIYIKCTSLLLSLELQDLKCKCLRIMTQDWATDTNLLLTSRTAHVSNGSLERGETQA